MFHRNDAVPKPNTSSVNTPPSDHDVPCVNTPNVDMFPTTTHLYYTLYRSLRRGSQVAGERRPPLPIEIISFIFREAHLLNHSPTPRLSIISNAAVSVNSHGSQVTTTVLATPPLTREWLTHVRQLRLTTKSMHQGGVSYPNHGCWSWFDVAIAHKVDDQPLAIKMHRTSSSNNNSRTSSPSPTRNSELAMMERRALFNPTPSWFREGQTSLVPMQRPRQRQAVNKPLRWKSHENVVLGDGYETIEGSFTPDHEIWQHLEPGDVIIVKACARFPGWANYCQEAKLEFWELFDPVPLALTLG